MTLKLIPSHTKGRRKYRANKGEEEPIICGACNGSLFFSIVASPQRKRMKLMKKSGYNGLLCVTCYLQGKVNMAAIDY